MTSDQEKCLGGFVTCNKYWEQQITALKELFQNHIKEIENKTTLAREAMELRIKTTADMFEVQLREIDQKTSLAKESMELRLTAMNEFRETLRDQAGRLMSRDEWKNEHDRVQRDVNLMRDNFKDKFADSVTKIEYNNELKTVQGEIQSLRTFKDGLQAVASQKSVTFALAVAISSLVLSALILVTRWMR